MTSCTYRYKLDPDILEHLILFADTHRYDDPPIFKEEWDKWVEQNEKMIEREGTRLKEAGYEKDVRLKLYRSARYYFKNKSLEKEDPRERRQYVGTGKDFRDAIDEHMDSIVRTRQLKPSYAYNDFIENSKYLPIINETREDIREYGFTTEGIDKKIKKAYKNRYFAQQKT